MQHWKLISSQTKTGEQLSLIDSDERVFCTYTCSIVDRREHWLLWFNAAAPVQEFIGRRAAINDAKKKAGQRLTITFQEE